MSLLDVPDSNAAFHSRVSNELRTDLQSLISLYIRRYCDFWNVQLNNLDATGKQTPVNQINPNAMSPATKLKALGTSAVEYLTLAGGMAEFIKKISPASNLPTTPPNFQIQYPVDGQGQPTGEAILMQVVTGIDGDGKPTISLTPVPTE